jgi:hypothetical protein
MSDASYRSGEALRTVASSIAGDEPIRVIVGGDLSHLR